MANTKIKFEAVVRCVINSDSEVPLYRWRRCNDEGRWLQGERIGDLDDLQTDLAGLDEIALVVPGTEVVTQKLSFNPAERKHLARLVPFQLEDHITSELDDLHFALGKIDDGQVTVAYLDREWLMQQISVLEGAGFEVHYCLVEPLMLPRVEPGWTLRYGDQVQVHYGEGLGFAVEQSMATLALTSLAESEALPENLLLIGADQEEVRILYELLPETVRDQISREHIDVQIADEWDSLALDNFDPLDLRQGELARRLPFKKWWQDWRTVGIVGAVAFFAYVGVNLAQIQLLNMRQADLQEQILAAYRQVVPQGAVANPEQQLRTQIARFEGSGANSALMPLLAELAPLVSAAEEISLRSFNYNNQRQEIRVNLQAKDYNAIRQLTQAMEQKGLTVDLRNSGAQGELQQAILVVSGVRS